MASNKDEVTVVLPTLNEEHGIGQIISELKLVGYNNILVVDGYSTDGTAKVAESNGCYVVMQHSMGKCGAIETAIENVKTPYMLIMDGDCTYDPKDIGNLMTHAENYDQIIGVRANGRAHIPRLNRFGNRMITTTFNVLMGTKLTDVCSGMYVLKTEAARQLQLNTKGFDVEVEIAAQTASRGKITEVPIGYRKRVGAQKLSSFKHGFQIVRAIFGLARAYNPAFLFSALAALAVFPASVMLGWAALDAFLYGVSPRATTSALTGLVLLLFASQGIVVATISVLLKRMESRLRSAQLH